MQLFQGRAALLTGVIGKRTNQSQRLQDGDLDRHIASAHRLFGDRHLSARARPERAPNLPPPGVYVTVADGRSRSSRGA